MALIIEDLKHFEEKLLDKNPQLVYFVFMVGNKDVKEVQIICYYGGMYTDSTPQYDEYHINGCRFSYQNQEFINEHTYSELNAYLKSVVKSIKDQIEKKLIK